LAGSIEKKHGIKSELIEGSGGIFDVKLDGKLIYSKFRTGRFPEHQEILDAISP